MAGILVVAVPGFALAQAGPSETTSTVTTTTATPVRAAPARAPKRRANNPKAVPWDALSDKSPIGNLPPRVTPGRPVGAISTTPAVRTQDPGDAGMSKTSPTTPQ